MKIAVKKPAEQNLVASPNGTADVNVERRATVQTKTTISERGVVMRTQTTYENLEDFPDPGATHCIVDAGHTVGQSIEYQSVQTNVRVTIPVAVDPKAIKKAFKHAWQIVEEELDSRGRWAGDTIRALAEIKRESEGR